MNALAHANINLFKEELIIITTRLCCEICMKLLNQYKVFAIVCLYFSNYETTIQICKERNILLINYNQIMTNEIASKDKDKEIKNYNEIFFDNNLNYKYNINKIKNEKNEIIKESIIDFTPYYIKSKLEEFITIFKIRKDQYSKILKEKLDFSYISGQK